MVTYFYASYLIHVNIKCYKHTKLYPPHNRVINNCYPRTGEQARNQ